MKSSVRDGVAEERELLLQISQRNEEALERLYDRYSRLLYSIILAVLHDVDEAQDTLQEVFVQIWHNAASFDPNRGTPYSWLVALTRNRSIDKLRSKSFRERQQQTTSLDDIVEEYSSDSHSPLDATTISERSAVVRAALQQLSFEQRDLLTRAYFQGYTQSELAKELNIPLGTVKTRMRQGLQKLHDIIFKEFPDERL
jgi:RNA polymerase sigma-70 factor (ECF subfamily)